MPSPTAATLHALHYLRTDVLARQRELAGRDTDRRLLLEVPVLAGELSDEEKRHELETNAQSILGYVVRWVGLGIGCSTVPDLAGVGLMEDRATLRISSQLIANWLHHGLVDEAQVRDTFARMAEVVDEQNAASPATGRWPRTWTAASRSRPRWSWCSPGAPSPTATPSGP